jgi:hypothetical protein
MTTTRYGRVAAAIVIAAALTGCGHAASRHPAPTPATTVAPAGAVKAGAARTSLLMVLDDYEREGAAVKTGKPKKDYGDDMTKYYADGAAMARIHGGGGVGAPIGCGQASGKTVIDGAVVGNPTSSGGTITLPVTLYTGTAPVTNVAVTATDAGKLTGFTCQPPSAPNLPGAAVLAKFYGGVAAVAADPEADDKTKALKDQFVAPDFAKFTRTDVDADQSLCAEDTMTYWHAAYDPAATTTGAQWYFNPGGSNQVNMSVAVDPAGSRVAWVYCFGQLTPPLTPGGAYSDSQVQSFVGDLFNDYAYLQALKPFGADTSGMKVYFASETAYQAAEANTGAQPLECSSTAATSIGADNVAVTGTTAVVDLTSSPSGHPVDTGDLGHPKVTVDMATLKITNVACG